MSDVQPVSWREEYDFASNWFDLSGYRYHYLDVGSGPYCVLAVHGNPTWSFTFRELARQLPADPETKRMRVVAVDHLGCGFSDKPQAYPYSLARHRDNLLQLIKHLDLRKIILVAHDWGGAIGLAAAVRELERFAGLVLLNTAAFPPPYVPRRIAMCRLPVVGTLALRGLNAFSRAAITMAVASQPLSASAAAGLLAPYGNWNDRVAVQAFVNDIPTSRRHPMYAVLEELEQGLSHLTDLPTRLVWGMRDWCFRPECLHRLQGLLPQAITTTLPEVGHYVMEEAPHRVIEAVRGLRDHLDQVGE